MAHASPAVPRLTPVRFIARAIFDHFRRPGTTHSIPIQTWGVPTQPDNRYSVPPEMPTPWYFNNTFARPEFWPGQFSHVQPETGDGDTLDITALERKLAELQNAERKNKRAAAFDDDLLWARAAAVIEADEFGAQVQSRESAISEESNQTPTSTPRGDLRRKSPNHGVRASFFARPNPWQRSQTERSYLFGWLRHDDWELHAPMRRPPSLEWSPSPDHSGHRGMTDPPTVPRQRFEAHTQVRKRQKGDPKGANVFVCIPSSRKNWNSVGVDFGNGNRFLLDLNAMRRFVQQTRDNNRLRLFPCMTQAVPRPISLSFAPHKVLADFPKRIDHKPPKYRTPGDIGPPVGLSNTRSLTQVVLPTGAATQPSDIGLLYRIWQRLEYTLKSSDDTTKFYSAIGAQVYDAVVDTVRDDVQREMPLDASADVVAAFGAVGTVDGYVARLRQVFDRQSGGMDEAIRAIGARALQDIEGRESPPALCAYSVSAAIGTVLACLRQAPSSRAVVANTTQGQVTREGFIGFLNWMSDPGRRSVVVSLRLDRAENFEDTTLTATQISRFYDHMGAPPEDLAAIMIKFESKTVSPAKLFDMWDEDMQLLGKQNQKLHADIMARFRDHWGAYQSSLARY